MQLAHLAHPAVQSSLAVEPLRVRAFPAGRPARGGAPAMHIQASVLACAIAVLGWSAASASAQSAPDAGALLQQIEQSRHLPLPPRAAPQFMAPPPLQSLGGASVVVTSFRFAGNTLLSAAAIAPAVAGFLNRPLDFEELQNAAIAVATLYRQAGWVVRVYLPQQDIDGGVLTIQIVEAVFGAVHLEGEATRVFAPRLKSLVEAAQRPGAPVNGDSLDRALLLIDDLPGVKVRGRLSEGRNQAETDLVLTLADAALVTGDMAVDNGGARSTGAARASASINLNSPLHLADQAGAILVHSRGSDYLRASYTLPLGSHGWRVGLNASHLAYRVLTLAQLDAQGTSGTAGLEAYYPLLRSRLKNLYFAFTLDQKRFDNRSAGAITTRYRTEAASLGLSGNLFDGLGGSAASSASIALVQGQVNLAGSPNEAADAASTQTAGSFHKLRFAATREQVLSDAVSLYAGLSAQLAGKNLDSSEKFYLGGAGGVRAYPASEGGGSEGQLLNLEVRARLPANFKLAAFFDWGSVRVNKNNNLPGAAVLNAYQLKGGGVSLGWVASQGLSVKATLARRIGNNPNPTATGSDQDGSLDRTRFWLQASLPF